MGLVSALRPSKITGRRYSNNNYFYVNGGCGDKEIEVLNVSYVHEIDDKHVLLALEELRQTRTSAKSKGNRRPLTPPRNPPRIFIPASSADILLKTVHPESPMSLADSSVSSDNSDESDKRKSSLPRPRPHPRPHSRSRSHPVPNEDDHNKSSSRYGFSITTADANTNTHTHTNTNINTNINTNTSTYSRISRIPESFRNMAKSLPHWERIRSVVTRLSEMNCLGEENVTLEETVENYGGFADFLLDRDEGGTTFDDTFEGNTFDEVATFDDALLSSLIDGINSTSIEHPNIRSIFNGSTVDDTHLSSLLKVSTISYEAASDDLDNDNNNVDSHHHDHPNDKNWNNEEKNSNSFTRNRKDHNERSPSSPLKQVSLELESGLKSSDGIDNGILRSLIVIPTTISTKQNRPLDEDDDGTRDFFDDDTFSLLTTDIALLSFYEIMKN